MSTIIKSDNKDRLIAVRPVTGQPEIGMPTTPESESVRLVAELEAQLRQRDDAMAALRREVESAREQGKAEGRKRGLQEAQKREAERLQHLEKAIGSAQSDLRSSLAATERLAVLIARECLDKLLNNADSKADLVCELVRAQLDQIDRASLLSVDVSAIDFPDEAALAPLIAKSRAGDVVVKAREDMPSGDCTMTLHLGKIAFGLDQQWGAISALLHDMASPGEIK